MIISEVTSKSFWKSIFLSHLFFCTSPRSSLKETNPCFLKGKHWRKISPMKVDNSPLIWKDFKSNITSRITMFYFLIYCNSEDQSGIRNRSKRGAWSLYKKAWGIGSAILRMGAFHFFFANAVKIELARIPGKLYPRCLELHGAVSKSCI